MEERPRFELRQVKSDGTEKIELCSLEEVLKQVGEISMRRRKNRAFQPLLEVPSCYLQVF